MYNSLVFSINIFTELVNHHHYMILEQLSSSQKETHQPTTIPPPWVSGASDLLSVSMDFPLVDISYKWNHSICSLLCLLLLLSFCMFSRFIHVVACMSTLFLFMAEGQPILQIYYILSEESSALFGLLLCFVLIFGISTRQQHIRKKGCKAVHSGFRGQKNDFFSSKFSFLSFFKYQIRSDQSLSIVDLKCFVSYCCRAK